MSGARAEVETITIYGRQISLHNETKPVDFLKLNPQNPRIRHEYYLGDNIPSEQELESIIWDMDATKRLYRSILVSQGIQNPLYIKASGLVVEGARRTVVARKMKENLDTGSFSEQESKVARRVVNNIPVKILPDDISEKEIDILLAREHISGKYPWPAVNQAEHIYRMYQIDGFPIQTIAETIERSRPWVYQKLGAFTWTREYLRRKSQGKLTDYSFFEELYKKKGALKRIADFDADDDENRRYFEELISDGKIPMAIQVRKLPELLADPEAKTILEKDGYKKAYSVLISKDPSLGSSAFKKIADAIQALQTMPRNEYYEIASDDAKQKLITKLQKEIQNILDELQIT